VGVGVGTVLRSYPSRRSSSPDWCRASEYDTGGRKTKCPAIHHAEAHALVAIHEVAEVFAGSGDGDALAVTQLMQATVHPEVRVPVLAVRCDQTYQVAGSGGSCGAHTRCACERPEQEGVDLDHLLDGTRRWDHDALFSAR
jgi:hypothetical protein